MIKFFLAFVSLLSVMSVHAQVPTKALTFDTNIDVINATGSRLEKILKAQELIKAVVATSAFRDAVLNHTYGGVKRYVDNEGLSNQQIYDKFLDGAEELNRIANNMMDMEIETYYENSNTVGYTNTGTKRVWMNTKYLDAYTPAEVTSNMTHEWLHKLGFSHAVYYSTSRDYSVPYAIGRIMGGLARNVTVTPTTSMVAATNLTLVQGSTTINLKWTAATSPAGIREYKIYRKLSGSTTAYLQGTSTSLSFTQTIPSSNASYYVKAVDNDGKTLNSSSVSYVKLTFAAPTSLTLTKTTTLVALKWSAAPLAVYYKVYRRLDGSTTNYLQSTTTNLYFAQSRPSKKAYYYVRSVDSAGNTLKSSEVIFYP